MAGESFKPAVEPTGAVFLSYASEDVEAAERIATALRAAGIEVWFDREELRGGDAWDQRIRQQILDCRLFIPIVSANTETRLEGYFRREWKLAVDRTDGMAGEVAFLFPVVIDMTPNSSAHVPEKFRHVQWTRLADEQAPPAFVERVRRLLSREGSSPQAATWLRRGSSPLSISVSPGQRSWRSHRLLWVGGVVLAMALGGTVVVWRHSIAPTSPAAPAAEAAARPHTPAAFNPPPHSIAVLPFVNMSGDQEQEYFAEGLTEELLDSLARINELQVAARTSSFSFQGEHPDIATVAHKLNVASVLEGSVRRSRNTIRVTAQLNNAMTGFHLWSQTYDRELKDVLALQTEIATAVAHALRVTLLEDAAAKIEVGGTRNPAAFDAYLRASKMYWDHQIQRAVTEYTKAIEFDPRFALAYAARSIALQNIDPDATNPAEYKAYIEKLRSDARMAIALAPDLGEGHLAMSGLYEGLLEFTNARDECERAVTLAPEDARILRDCGDLAIRMGDGSAGLAWLRHAVALDPLNVQSHFRVGHGLWNLRRYAEAIQAFRGAEALEPGVSGFGQAIAYYMLGDLQAASSQCSMESDQAYREICLAMIYAKLGRRADAEAMLAKLRARDGDDGALRYAWILAQWGNKPKAVEWLEAAMRAHRDVGLSELRTNPLLDPLRNEPRFQAVEKALRFPG